MEKMFCDGLDNYQDGVDIDEWLTAHGEILQMPEMGTQLLKNCLDIARHYGWYPKVRELQNELNTRAEKLSKGYLDFS